MLTCSEQIKREVERSVSKGNPVITFKIEDVKPSKTLEYYISTPHWLDAITPPLEVHLQHLVKTMRLILSQKEDNKIERDGSLYCKKCKIDIPSDHIYCPKCGIKIEEPIDVNETGSLKEDKNELLSSNLGPDRKTFLGNRYLSSIASQKREEQTKIIKNRSDRFNNTINKYANQKKWNKKYYVVLSLIILLTITIYFLKMEQNNKITPIIGRNYSKEIKYDLSIHELNKLIEINPKDAYPYFYRGMAYDDKKKMRKQLLTIPKL